jgi:uncharacterized membrane protein YphA (DoxX/SURF4 family)
MPNKWLSPAGLWANEALAITRIMAGLFMAYHGWEVFADAKMDNYSQWLTELRFPMPATMAYLGKGAELVSGILLILGLFTRAAALILALTMAAICFGMGKGRIFMEDQHPFLFILFGFLFFFTGPGSWSLDGRLFSSVNRN